eukprot:563086-Amphidinium_carterae.1
MSVNIGLLQCSNGRHGLRCKAPKTQSGSGGFSEHFSNESELRGSMIAVWAQLSGFNGAPALRADKDFVQRAIEHHPEALCHAHANLRADAE